MECQNAAMTYERACQLHKGARDTISVAEDKLMHNPTMFDQAWQEMLNSANTKVGIYLLYICYYWTPALRRKLGIHSGTCVAESDFLEKLSFLRKWPKMVKNDQKTD